MAVPLTAHEAALLVLLERHGHDSEGMTISEISIALKDRGIKAVRPDRLLENCLRDGDVAVSGGDKARRFSLTATGIDKARQFRDRFDTSARRGE